MKFNEKPFGISSWITTPDEINNPAQVHCVWFKKSFRHNNTSCKLRIAVHNRYKIYINKKRFAVGPCEGNRWSTYWDEWQIDNILQEGENEILIQVLYYPSEGFDQNTNGGPMSSVSYMSKPCLLMNSDNKDLITGASGWQVTLNKSINWVTQKLPSFTCVGPVEECNFGYSPLNETFEYTWYTPQVIGVADAFGFGEHSPFMLKERPIPYLLEHDKKWYRHMPIKKNDLPSFKFTDDKATIPISNNMICELDAGDITNAYISTKFKGKGIVRFTYAECYVEYDGFYYKKGRRDDWENYKILGFNDVVEINGECTYEPFDWRSFRFIRIEAESYDEPLEIEIPKINAIDFPMEVSAKFESNVSWTKPLWDISIRTLKRCMTDRYMDCPYYERMQYLLDTRLESLYTYCLSSDTRLSKKAIEDYHATLTPDGMVTSRAPTNRYNVIPNFALHFIMMLEEYYMQTADVKALKQYMPTVQAILGWYERKLNDEGMIVAKGYWNFVDWCEDWVNEDGILLGEPEEVKDTGISTTNTLMYAAALKSTARMLIALGRCYTANDMECLAKSINKKVLKCCVNEEGLMCEIPENNSLITQHAQVWAVLSGAVDTKQGRQMLLNSLKRKDGQCTFVMRFFLLRALEKVGLYHLADDILKPWIDALDLNITTWPEDFARQRSDCHAWSSIPIYEFTSCVLGIKPLEAGWKRILIKPHMLSFKRIEGSVPTPVGEVWVKWELKHGVFYIECNAPYGIPVVMELPDGSRHLYIGGNNIKSSIIINHE